MKARKPRTKEDVTLVEVRPETKRLMDSFRETRESDDALLWRLLDELAWRRGSWSRVESRPQAEPANLPTPRAK